jgi:hypothetical protein
MNESLMLNLSKLEEALVVGIVACLILRQAQDEGSG